MGKAKGSVTRRNPAATARAKKAMKLREQGKTYREIAAAVGYTSPATAYNVIMRELSREMPVIDNGFRNYESQRIDGLIEEYLPAALEGDLQAAHFILKGLAQRAKLHGLEITTTQGETKHSGEIRVVLEQEADWRGRKRYDDSNTDL